MSALDQAFIKAYRRGAARPAAPETNSAQYWSSSTRPATKLDMSYDAPAAAPVPPPHTNFAVPSSGWPAAAAAPSTRVEPAYEVARFNWPRMIEELAVELGDQLSDCGAALAQRAAQHRKLILVTGSQRGEGRSSLALLMARAVASRGLRVAIADADVRRPSLATLLGVAPTIGWSAVAAGVEPLEEALVESARERLTLLPWAPTDTSIAIPQGELARGAMASALAMLREQFDLVLVDVGPLESDSAAIDLAAALVGCPIDDALICRDTSRAEVEPVARVARRVAAMGVARWDVIDNFVRRG